MLLLLLEGLSRRRLSRRRYLKWKRYRIKDKVLGLEVNPVEDMGRVVNELSTKLLTMKRIPC
jgi:hypothetical protein